MALSAAARNQATRQPPSAQFSSCVEVERDKPVADVVHQVERSQGATRALEATPAVTGLLLCGGLVGLDVDLDVVLARAWRVDTEIAPVSVVPNENLNLLDTSERSGGRAR